MTEVNHKRVFYKTVPRKFLGKFLRNPLYPSLPSPVGVWRLPGNRNDQWDSALSHTMARTAKRVCTPSRAYTCVTCGGLRSCCCPYSCLANTCNTYTLRIFHGQFCNRLQFVSPASTKRRYRLYSCGKQPAPHRRMQQRRPPVGAVMSPARSPEGMVGSQNKSPVVHVHTAICGETLLVDSSTSAVAHIRNRHSYVMPGYC